MIARPSLEAAKAQARAIRPNLASKGRDIPHSAAWELPAKSCGQRDRNTLHAAICNEPRPPVCSGQIMPDHYLKQAYLAEVAGPRQISDRVYEVTLDFDKPVDEVTFNCFPNFRRKVRKLIGTQGRLMDKTTDGLPHPILSG